MKHSNEGNTLPKLSKWALVGATTVMLVQGVSSTAMAGAFIFSGEDNGVDIITHPSGYTGTGGPLTVNLCIVPGTPNAASMVIPLENIAAKMSAQAGKVGNLSTSDGGDPVPFSEWDFESVALHEVGHCMGLAHVNAATESGLSGEDREYTKATNGVDNVFNINAGVDAQRGTRDDVRGDDVNLHWFRIGTNDPCADPGTSTYDASTYTRDGALPAGHLFAANADVQVCGLLGSANTEAVMQQGSPNGQAQRFLSHDDAAMLRLAMSGVDEVQGTADDYSLTVNSLGISSSSDCDVNLSFNDAQTGFAVCQTGGSFINSNHVRITSANSYFNTSAVTWFFNTTLDAATNPTTTSVVSDGSPSIFGNTVTFTATVTGTAPTGTVDFLDGASVISGCNDVALAGGGNNPTATCMTAGLAVGARSIKASYSGDGTSAASESPTIVQNVTAQSAPGAFSRVSPADLATDQPAETTLSWGTSAEAASYEYCIDDIDDDACSSWVSTGSNTSASLSGLSLLTTYYWHVRANNPSGTTYAGGSATAFWSFTTEDSCNINVAPGQTVNSSALEEACELLIVGTDDFVVEDGASASLSSGVGIFLLPGLSIEQGATLDANVCGQSLCLTSPDPMPNGCHSCVTQICAADPFCCGDDPNLGGNFDSFCLAAVDSVCNLVCE